MSKIKPIGIGSELTITVGGSDITASVVAIGDSDFAGRSTVVAVIQHPIRSSGVIEVRGIDGGCGNAVSRVANGENVIDVLIPTDHILRG